MKKRCRRTNPSESARPASGELRSSACNARRSPPLSAVVLAQSELTVDRQPVDGVIGPVLIDEALRPLLETRRVIARPPVRQHAVRPVLSAGIRRNHGSSHDRSRRRCRRNSPHRRVRDRMKGSCRMPAGKIDAVLLAAVIGVHGRRRHMPLAGIDQPADPARAPAASRRRPPARHCRPRRRPDRQRGIVAPPVGERRSSRTSHRAWPARAAASPRPSRAGARYPRRRRHGSRRSAVRSAAIEPAGKTRWI